MKAVVWMAPGEVRVTEVPEPTVVNPRDAVVRVHLSAVRGSDLSLFEGQVPGLRRGDVLGHEFVGEIAEVGPELDGLRPGDRVVVSANIACGRCWYCQAKQFALCDNANPNAHLVDEALGSGGAGMFGCSELLGGYAGSHAEYVRVPFADVGAFKIPETVRDDQALFVSDSLPSAYSAAERCDIRSGDVVAVWGCGAFGQFAIRSALLLGASRVIAIDRSPFRLQLARRAPGVEALGFGEVDDLADALRDMTGGRGPDACIDAWSDACGELGARHRGTSRLAAVGHEHQDVECSTIMRQMIRACRKGGTISTVGVHAATLDAFPVGVAAHKGLSLRTGRGDPQRHARALLRRVAEGELDPSFAVTRRLKLGEAANAFTTFKHASSDHVAVVLDPTA